MRNLPSFSTLTFVLLAISGCPASTGGDDAADDSTDTGDGDGDPTGDGDGDPTGDGDGDPTGGEAPSECTQGCAAQLDCGRIGADEVATCEANCALDLEGHTQVFGDECAQARAAALVCLYAAECTEDYGPCEEIGIAAFFACTQTLIPELDALCECVAGDVVGDPSDPISPKQACVASFGAFGVELFVIDGQTCLDSYVTGWACAAAACENPSCEANPAPSECECDEAEAAILAACPDL
jgi:hypothetical protein